jgi:hypothetical protein
MASRPMSELVSTRESRLTVVALAAIGVAFMLYQRELDVPPVDDAGISAAFARTFAEGGGLRLTHHSQVVEGFSNPSWTLLLVLASMVGLDPLHASTWMGGLAAVACLLVVACWPALAQGRELRLEDAAAAALPWPVSSYTGSR